MYRITLNLALIVLTAIFLMCVSISFANAIPKMPSIRITPPPTVKMKTVKTITSDMPMTMGRIAAYRNVVGLPAIEREVALDDLAEKFINERMSRHMAVPWMKHSGFDPLSFRVLVLNKIRMAKFGMNSFTGFLTAPHFKGAIRDEKVTHFGYYETKKKVMLIFMANSKEENTL